MKISDLRRIGVELRESVSSTIANFDALTSDLKKKVKREGEIVVHVKQVSEFVYEYSFSAPKKLKEEEIADTAPEDVWASNKESAKTYISNTVYYVKKLEGGQKFEVTVVDGTTRKPFANLSAQDLDKSFTPVRPNQNPDAEGFVQYRKVDEVEAFKYTDETEKLNGVLISKGDYLIRTPKGNEFVYEVKKAKDFEASYTEK